MCSYENKVEALQKENAGEVSDPKVKYIWRGSIQLSYIFMFLCVQCYFYFWSTIDYFVAALLARISATENKNTGKSTYSDGIQ